MLHRTLSVLCVVAFAVTSFAQSLKVEKYVLPNGLTVVLHEDHALPIVSLNILYRVGSKDEPPQRSGFAHLFEHLMFMGTNRVPTGQFDQIMERGGGSNNANTTEDRTDYFSDGPASLLPTLLWLDADRMDSLGKAMDQKKLDLQRDVVKNERRENTENTPYGRAYEAINGLMFPVGHPYHNSVIGSMADLDRASVKDVQDFFGTYYVPNNAVLVVAGDFDSATVKPTIASYFGAIPRRSDPQHLVTGPVKLSSVQRLTFVDNVQASKVVMVWHSPAAYQPGDSEMDLTASILSSGLSSRLYQRLVVKDKLATDVSAFQESRLLGSLFTVDATAAEGVSLDAMEAAIDDELKTFTGKGPTKEEMQRQVSKLEFAFASGLQSVHTKAEQLAAYQVAFGDPNGFQRDMDRYRSATRDSVRRVALATLDPNARLVMRIVPEPQAGNASALDEQPKVEAEKPFTLPSPSEFTLSNGLKVFYWQRPDVPLMTVSMQFRRGADADPAAKSGRTNLMADMLDQGAGTRKGEEYEKALDLLGANVSAGAGQRSLTISLAALSAKFEPAIGLYADAVLRPRFDEDAFVREQRVTAAGIEQSLDDPGAVARLVANREYFGAANPLSRPVSGTAATVRSLTVGDLREAYKEIVQPSGATLFVAGSLPEAAVRADLDKAFGGWKGTGAPTSPIAYPAPANTALRVVVVDRPDAVQTVIRFMMPAPAYGDPRRQTLESLNTILGGSFTSRLNQNLREEHGYAYGAGSGFNFLPQLGTLTASAAVRADVTGPALKEFLNEFRKIRGGDITEVEAGKAASTRRSDMISALGTLQGLLGTAMVYSLNDRPFSDVGVELSRLSSINAGSLNAAANAAIPLEQALIVLVGDKATILKALEGTDLPKPDIVTVTGG